MNRQQQIQQLTNASASLTGVIDRLRAQESSSEGTRTAHSTEASAGGSNVTDQQILTTVSEQIAEVSASFQQ